MIYAEGTRVRAGRAEAIGAVRSVASLIAPTLGPSGSDVLITSPFGEISTTNDGATILRSVPLTHPAARIAADIALTQEQSVGDGTTSAVVLASALLDGIEPLIETIRLRGVLAGLESAHERIETILEDESRPLASGDLARIVTTALSGKGGEMHAQLIAGLLESSLPEPDAPVMLMSRSGAPMRTSKRIDGIVIDRLPVRDDMPRSIEDARILLVSGALEAKRAEGVSLGSTEEIERYFESEQHASSSIARSIIDSGANVVVCRKGVDDPIQYELSRAGILVVRRIPLEHLETIARASGAVIVPSVGELTDVLGRACAVRVDEALKSTIIEATSEPSSTILLRGSTEHIAEELERAAHDALGVVRATLRTRRTLPGALVIESRISRLEGDDVIEAVANAYASLAMSVLEPAGIDAIPSSGGIDARDGRSVDARAEGIIEPIDVKRSAISSTFEIATTIVRVETIVTLPDPRLHRT